MVDSKITDFDVICELGSGSFGTVRKVRRKEDNLIYCIKEVRIGELSKVEQQDAINEVNILAKLDSPFIVAYYDSFIESNYSLYIVMEFCNRGDLQKLHRSAREKGAPGLTEWMTWDIGLQVVLGLNYLHNEKVLHRDLKAANVFLQKQPKKSEFKVKIGDLGVAKLLETSNAFAQTLVGTPYYLSPELCTDKPYRDKSDCWALGVLLYECCTLSRPFEARNQGALIMKIVNSEVKVPSKTKVSPELKRLILWLLQKEPKRRPNIRDILREAHIQERLAEHNFDIPEHILELDLRRNLDNDDILNAKLNVGGGDGEGGGGDGEKETDGGECGSNNSTPANTKGKESTGTVSSNDSYVKEANAIYHDQSESKDSCPAYSANMNDRTMESYEALTANLENDFKKETIRGIATYGTKKHSVNLRAANRYNDLADSKATDRDGTGDVNPSGSFRPRGFHGSIDDDDEVKTDTLLPPPPMNLSTRSTPAAHHDKINSASQSQHRDAKEGDTIDRISDKNNSTDSLVGSASIANGGGGIKTTTLNLEPDVRDRANITTNAGNLRGNIRIKHNTNHYHKDGSNAANSSVLGNRVRGSGTKSTTRTPSSKAITRHQVKTQVKTQGDEMKIVGKKLDFNDTAADNCDDNGGVAGDSEDGGGEAIVSDIDTLERKQDEGDVAFSKDDESAHNSESKAEGDTDSKSVGDRDSGSKAIDIVKDVISSGVEHLSLRSKPASQDANNDEKEAELSMDTNEYTGDNFHSFRGTIKPIVGTITTPPAADKVSATIEVVDRFNNTLSTYPGQDADEEEYADDTFESPQVNEQTIPRSPRQDAERKGGVDDKEVDEFPLTRERHDSYDNYYASEEFEEYDEEEDEQRLSEEYIMYYGLPTSKVGSAPLSPSTAADSKEDGSAGATSNRDSKGDNAASLRLSGSRYKSGLMNIPEDKLSDSVVMRLEEEKHHKSSEAVTTNIDDDAKNGEQDEDERSSRDLSLSDSQKLEESASSKLDEFAMLDSEERVQELTEHLMGELGVDLYYKISNLCSQKRDQIEWKQVYQELKERIDHTPGLDMIRIVACIRLIIEYHREEGTGEEETY